MKINISTVFQNTCPFGVRDRTTVDGRNPAPVGMVNIPLSIGSYTSQVVQDFFHQQYQVTLSNPVNKKDAKNLKKTIQHSCNKWCFPVSAWDTHRENRWFSDVYFFPSKNTTKTYLKLEKKSQPKQKNCFKVLDTTSTWYFSGYLHPHFLVGFVVAKIWRRLILFTILSECILNAVL